MPSTSRAVVTRSLRDIWHRNPLAQARQRLFERDEAILAWQIELSEIAAPTGEEGARAASVKARFEAERLTDVRTDAAGNVIARRAGAVELPPVVVCAHLDTVFPRDVSVRVRRDGARLMGPGIGDNGRGLAAMLAMAAVIDGRRVRTLAPIDFVGTVGEEGAGDLRGAKHLFGNGYGNASAAIAIDGAGDERIVHRALGSRRYRITYRGIGGHSWSAFGVPHPVHATAVAAAKLARIALPSEPRTTLSVGRIGGGLSVNAIPDEGWLEVDVRSTSPVNLERVERELRSAARAAEVEENDRRQRGTPPLSLSIDVIGDRPTGETPEDHPLVVSALEATRLVGRDPELTTASTDANVPISLGIPAIALGGGGRGGDAHTAAEWFENAEGRLGLARALGIIVAAAGLAE
ncbi:MAG TPA: M20/M25/M40 family metallo-hydrolase [Gemmatimonadaceae bacterium]|jgi:tripeptide aminopeptidase|nr:M20/M25/M40 family metallo-hydrolase [Gemmatimonadaceae bacterium]